ncbi:MAG TPA: DEAD/DEAH box helicase [Magnetospirillum sp.]|nr:DEAD/DEAH box helicase [Magnetospirillum sp.]
MLCNASGAPPGLREAVEAAAAFHDLGKLDPDVQAALHAGRQTRLPWDHVDAGVAHLQRMGNDMAAWLVRAHHAPGLPSFVEEFGDDKGRKLRGGRRGDEVRGAAQVNRTDQHLADYLRTHEAAAGHLAIGRLSARHGLAMRLALSCLVDADYEDSARADGHAPPSSVGCRWQERLDRLVACVGQLGRDKPGPRNCDRAAFFDACLASEVTAPMVSCEAPVGLGKTTAVMAHMLRRAAQDNLRHIIVVAPYTTIISQTVAALREFLCLDGESPAHVVAEHHHRVDFSDREDRSLAGLWRAPVTVTTAVQFFETLAASTPARLRKLHELPGSAVILDEAHAALPAHLWPQNWRWIRELATSWGCRFAFSSGSLVRFWENPGIIADPERLPELLPPALVGRVFLAERRRIRSEQAPPMHAVADLAIFVTSKPGPRLLILNTVQSAAVVAQWMRNSGYDVLHLSTALCPGDREVVLHRVKERLRESCQEDWTLVATSCVEAGVELSFRNGFRERFSTASLIQTGGRVNRHGEYDGEGGGVVFDFVISEGDGITHNPSAEISRDVLKRQFRSGAVTDGTLTPAQLATNALAEEIRDHGGPVKDVLGMFERQGVRNYPKVSEAGRVIDADTRFVVVDQLVRQRLERGEAVTGQEVIRGSVQIYCGKIKRLNLEPLPGRSEVYSWDYPYDPHFLGYMAGVIAFQQPVADSAPIV